jgi:hypothetical protein
MSQKSFLNIINNKINNLIDRFEELLILQFPEPTNATNRIHKSTWFYSKPYLYKRGQNNLVITFDNSRRLYISYKWNLENYLKETVPLKYHTMLRNLMNNIKSKIE